jgi:hypothetical protein
MIERLLRKMFRHEDLGIVEVGEKFTRFLVLEAEWPFKFNVFIHKMWTPVPAPECHDHPWDFASLVLSGGYGECTEGSIFHWRRPGSLKFYKAEHAHKTVTDGVPAWTFVITGPARRQWANKECR